MTKEKVKKWNDNFFKWYNINEDGYTYVAVGDTYSIKDELKKNGAKFNKEIGWSFKEDPGKFKTIKISVDSIAYKKDSGTYHLNPDIGETMKEFHEKFIEPTNSEWVGEIGEKVLTWGTLKNTHQFQGTFGLTTVLTFSDEEENSIVWMTTKNVPIEIGDFCEIEGTVKAHNTFRGDKQTLLTRCRYEILNRKED